MGARKGSIFKSKHNFSISEGLCCNNLFPIKKTFSDHWWHNRTLKWPRNRNNNTFGSEHDLTKAIRVKYRIKETDQRESASRGPATLHTGAPMPCHISIQTTWNGKRSGEEKTKNLIIEVQQQPRISGSRLRGAMVFVEPGRQTTYTPVPELDEHAKNSRQFLESKVADGSQQRQCKYYNKTNRWYLQ